MDRHAALFYTYTWKRCQLGTCDTVGNGSSYTIPNSDGGGNYAYQVQVCAINLVSPTSVCRTSNPTTGTVAPVPGSAPYPLSGGTPASISPDPNVSYPWGTTFTIDPGQWGTESDATTAIAAALPAYRWQRCDSTLTCSVIPGATGASYTTTAADVGDSIAGYVQVSNGGFFPPVPSQFFLVAETFTTIEKTPVNTAAPKIVGAPNVGTTLDSTAGAWDGHDPTYARQWLECNSSGLQCQPISPNKTGSTYTITSADLGNTLELQVTATQLDPSQNRVAVATSPPTAVITNAPTGPGGGSPTPTPTPTPAPKPPPSLGRLPLGHKGNLATVVFSLSGSGSVVVALQRVTTGHRVRARCVSGKHKHARACTIYTTEYTIVRRGLNGGRITISLSTKVHNHLLPPGHYRVLVTPVSANGRRGGSRSLNLVLTRA